MRWDRDRGRVADDFVALKRLVSIILLRRMRQLAYNTPLAIRTLRRQVQRNPARERVSGVFDRLLRRLLAYVNT